MKFTFKLHDKKNKDLIQSVEILSIDKQDMPICLQGSNDEAIYCGLLGEQINTGNQG